MSTKNLSFKFQQEATKLQKEKEELSEKEKIIEWEKENLVIEYKT